MERVDFHVHYENGTEFDANFMFNEAVRRNVVALALIGRLELSDNLSEYIGIGEKYGVRTLPGVEYPVRIEDTLVDLVFIGFDYTNAGIRNLFGKSERKKDNSRVALLQKGFLENAGFMIEGSSDETRVLLTQLLSGEISEKAISFCKIAVNNPKNKEKLESLKVEKQCLWDETCRKYFGRLGYTEYQSVEAKFIWKNYFDFGKPGFLPVQVNATNIIGEVHNAGGVALYSPEGKFDRKIWNTLCNIGVDGIMGWHGGKLEIDTKTIAETRTRGFLVMGGSDYHPGKKEWEVGIGNGDMYISTRRMIDFDNYHKRMKVTEL